MRGVVVVALLGKVDRVLFATTMLGRSRTSARARFHQRLVSATAVILDF
jgi:hypothetical protein